MYLMYIFFILRYTTYNASLDVTTFLYFKNNNNSNNSNKQNNINNNNSTIMKVEQFISKWIPLSLVKDAKKWLNDNKK